MEFKQIGIVGFRMGGLDERIMRGINQARLELNLPWMFRDGGWEGELLRGILMKHELAGVIGNIASQGTLSFLEDTKLPAINTSVEMETPFPRVSTRTASIGEVAGTYFKELGHHRILFATKSPYHSRDQEIWKGLKNVGEENGLSVWFWDWGNYQCIDQVGDEELLPHEEREGPALFLERVQRPYALFTSGDRLGKLSCEGCLVRGIRVPEEISVLGVDDIPFFCETATPPLSSVQQSGEEIGYRAVVMLEQLMDGKRPVDQVLDSPGVTTRRSTESIPIENPNVAELLHRMRSQFGQRTSIQELCRGIPIDRRSLERGFREELGRSPLDELYFIRISRSQELLRSTSLTIAEVADRCGFRDSDHFAQRFKRDLGETPSSFRKKNRFS